MLPIKSEVTFGLAFDPCSIQNVGASWCVALSLPGTWMESAQRYTYIKQIGKYGTSKTTGAGDVHSRDFYQNLALFSDLKKKLETRKSLELYLIILLKGRRNISPSQFFNRKAGTISRVVKLPSMPALLFINWHVPF